MKDKTLPIEVQKEDDKLNWVVHESPWTLGSIHKAFTPDKKDHWFWAWTGEQKFAARARELALLHGENLEEAPPLPEGY